MLLNKVYVELSQRFFFCFFFFFFVIFMLLAHNCVLNQIILEKIMIHHSIRTKNQVSQKYVFDNICGLGVCTVYFAKNSIFCLSQTFVNRSIVFYLLKNNFNVLILFTLLPTEFTKISLDGILLCIAEVN